MKWVAKEVKLKINIGYDLEVFPIIEDHLILQLKSANDCELALKGGPWFVARQLLAMEPWEPDFVPDRHPIQKTVVWV